VLLEADLQARFHAVARGVVDLRSLLHYAALTAVALCGAGLVVERRSYA
jgi:hypothetical protein